MARKSSKKQTRLAFAPAPAPHSEGGNDDGNDRFARLSYGHPSLSTVRNPGSRRGTPVSPKKEERSSKSFKRAQSPTNEIIKERKDEKNKKGKSKTEKREKRNKKKDKRTDKKRNQGEGEKTPPVQQDPGEQPSDDEVVMPRSAKRLRRREPSLEVATMVPPISMPNPTTSHAHSPAGSQEGAINISDSEEELIQPRRRLKRKAEMSPVALSDSEDSDELVVSSPVKRRKRNLTTETPQTPHSSANQDQLDIEEDLRDLEDSVVRKTRTRGRIAESSRNRRLQHLETLRRRRAGLKEESEIESESEDDQPQTSPIPQRFDFFNTHNENEDSEAESEIGGNEDLDRYEDDFVLEDDTAELGVPIEEIPFEFTRHAYKQTKEYFRDVVGWMVHNCVDPAFPRSDAMYQMAFNKLEDEVKGRAGSSLISSVWNAKFSWTLLARPHLELTAFPTEVGHSCDACNRSGHPASSDLKFFGKPYSLETLEPLSDESDDSDERDSNDDETKPEQTENKRDKPGVDRDKDGHILPHEDTRFYLGRTCKSNAYMAHTLTHWRYHLNEWVVDYLRRKGHMEDSEVLRRNNLSQKRKTRNAIDIIEQMAAAGEIENLYRDFHIHLKAAREKTSTME
ncbi:hypothetical protein N7462_005550 [Penicillium macrosclerotiorum]|uniref:uncharacterized protein n=1 Tax=Penicillium macrosclerotiorum TaxID=303699 RepID=UPI002546B8BB|nr:uncharacterized protein N7462_005550 [Penicillium macrosclerotiorum]KAJ5682385.1 hypothetical protein N7462_005550 [Penicillium macrosclerotiorum]